MSLAHLMVPKVARTRTAAAMRANPGGTAVGVMSYCGASREPIYRNLDEASESGLEVCASCLIDSRKPRKAATP
jgi:hypothetical protein